MRLDLLSRHPRVLIVIGRTAPQDRSGLCTPYTTRHSKEEPDGPVAPGPRTYVTEPGMLSTEHLYDIVMDADVQDVGVTPSGHRRFVHVTGGTFEGPRMRGTVLPGGGDWLVGRADGSRRLDVRIMLRTDDGALIYAHYPGMFHAQPDVLERIQSGADVDAAEYYFRVAP